MDSATQPGAETDTRELSESPAARQPESDNERQIRESNERSREYRRRTNGQFAASDEPVVDVEPEQSPEPEQEPEATPEPESLPFRRDESGKYRVPLKVDGAEEDAELDEVIKHAQMYRSSAKRFHQLDKERREFEAERQKFEQEKAQLAQQSTRPSTDAGDQSPPEGATQGIPDELWDKATLDGDQQARQELANALRGRQQPPIPPAQLQAMTTEQLKVAMQEIDAERTAAAVRSEAESAIAASTQDAEHGQVNAWILENNATLANRHSAELRESEPHLTPAENVNRALELARDEIARTFATAPQSSPALPSRTTEKQAHAAANIPGTGAASRTLTPVKPAPLTHEQSVARARAKERQARQI